jgi:hypothetical protein
MPIDEVPQTIPIRSRGREIAQGMSIVWLSNLVHLLLGLYFIHLYPPVLYALFGFAIVQLVYAVPLFLVAKRRKRYHPAKGMAVAGYITAVVSAFGAMCVYFIFRQVSLQ